MTTDERLERCKERCNERGWRFEDDGSGDWYDFFIGDLPDVMISIFRLGPGIDYLETILDATDPSAARIHIDLNCVTACSLWRLVECGMNWDRTHSFPDGSGYKEPDPAKCPGPAPEGYEYVLVKRKVVG